MPDLQPLDLTRALLELLQDAQGPLLCSAEELSFFRAAPPKPIERPQPQAPAPLPPPAPPKPVIAAPPTPEPPKLSLPPKTETRSHEDIRALLKKVAPHLPWIESPPDDTYAHQVSDQWKTRNLVAPITLLIYKDTHRPLLEAIATALHVLYGPARLVDAEPIEAADDWETFLATDNLKWVLMSDAALWQLTKLKTHYRESPRLLGKIPLFLLPDLDLYLKDPMLKKSLWRALQGARP